MNRHGLIYRNSLTLTKQDSCRKRIIFYKDFTNFHHLDAGFTKTRKSVLQVAFGNAEKQAAGGLWVAQSGEHCVCNMLRMAPW